MSLFKIFVFYFIYGAFGFNSASALEANFSLKSEILDETRKIIVHLPETYDAKHKNGYTVIYMLDAGNDDALTAETARKLNTAGIIISCIEHINNRIAAFEVWIKHGSPPNSIYTTIIALIPWGISGFYLYFWYNVIPFT